MKESDCKKDRIFQAGRIGESESRENILYIFMELLKNIFNEKNCNYKIRFWGYFIIDVQIYLKGWFYFVEDFK